jgi:hypothetical protein
MKRETIKQKYNGLCAYTGKTLGEDWQVDHVTPQHKKTENVNDLSNLLPCQRIVNHYKRGHDLEGFRQYMADFHVRLGKLPKKTMRPQTMKRIDYMNKVADAFEITPEKPFDGKFYFEKLEL